MKMSAAFVDSSFYVALLISRDSHHLHARQLAAAWNGPVVTTEYVLIEVANFLRGSAQRRQQFGALLANLAADPRTQIVESSRPLWQRGVDRYLNRPDKEWSLTDCISFAVMEEHNMTCALTMDHHFEQAGFIVLAS
ncbi:MAG TPA: PIN domain-containing protein [Lacipirellulaceae bacterium]|nr:PIN domain-containing protein [Lacipirellulaceae bacterium]HMP05430.1 PIN domain-containing protein [Lacipirellulaceae bacterium]